MRKSIPIALLNLSLALVCAAQSKPDGEKQTLVGAVETVATERAFISTTGKEAFRRVESMQRFDNFGNIVESVLYGTAAAIRVGDKEKLPVRKRTDFSYDALAGKIEEVTRDSKNDVTLKTVSTYDPKTRRLEVVTDSDRNALQTRLLYSYDTSGKLTERLSEGETPIEGRTTFSYAADGRLSEETHYKNGEVQNKTSYRYEANTRRINRIDFKAKDAVEDLVVVLRDLKKKTKEIAYFRADGTVAWKLTYSYDDKDNVIGEEFSNLEALNKYAYQYEFDSVGNWIKRTKLRWFAVSGKSEPQPAPIEVSFRTISYYPEPYQPIRDPIPLPYAKDQYAPGVDGVVLGDVIEAAELNFRPATGTTEIVVEVVVDKEGKVESGKPVSGPETLRSAALQAAKRFKFKPSLLNGFPVKTARPVTFAMNIIIQRR